MTQKQKNDNDVLMSKEEVFSMLELAEAFTQVKNGQFGYGYYTPDLLNQNLNNLGITPETPTYQKLIRALNNPQNTAEEIQAYSSWAECNDMLYARYIQYYANMLSFDLLPICVNAEKKDYKTKAFREDERKVWEFLDSFDYKSEFRSMVAQMLRQETVFTWLRTNKGTIKENAEIIQNNEIDNYNDLPKYKLQMMPQNFCTLTGYFEKGYLYDFDMNYFLQAGVDINGFDPSFKKKYNDIFNNDGIDKYIPTNPLNKRGGTFAYTVQTSPEDGAWVFKFDASNFSAMPFLSPTLTNILNNREIQALQKNKDIASAYAILAGELKMMDKQKSGNVKDAFAISPTTLGQFLGAISSGLKSSVQLAALPLENTDFYQYKDDNPDMYSNQLATSTSLGASASNLIYNTDKMSQEESRNAIMTDGNMMKKLYSQFGNFLEYYVNKLTNKFKFSFNFEGLDYPFERKDRQEKLKELAGIGIVLSPSAWGAAYGYKPQDFKRMLEEASGGDFTDNLVNLTSIHTSSGSVKRTSNNSTGVSTGKVGRPRKNSVNTQSREYDTSYNK